MYVQRSTEVRDSHCCEQFERRADLPDEEVDVLFLQRNIFYFLSFTSQILMAQNEVICTKLKLSKLSANQDVLA